MGTEVLRAQDCLTDRIRVSSSGGLFSRRRNYYGSYKQNSDYYCNYNYNNIYNNVSHHQNNSNGNGNGNARTSRKPAVRHERPDQRRHQRAQSEPSVSRRSFYDDNSTRTAKRSSSDDLKVVRSNDSNGVNNNNNKGLVMEKVMILRRGESFDSKIKSGGGGAAVDAELLGPADMYAGSGFAVSPAPSSLPLPSFSKKKQTSIDDSATRDIKRLLRLEL